MKKLFYIIIFGLLVLFIILSASVNVYADGTETLGPPLGITVASGSGIAAGGTGMVTQPGTITVDVPAGAVVRQVLLYWEGQSIGAVTGDNIISVNGNAVTGDLIGGPAYFFTTYGNNVWTSSFRADITSLNLITPGLNTLTLDGMAFTWSNDGAGVLVIYDDGSVTSDIQVRDGLDLAFINFPEPRKSTVLQTYYFTSAGVDRTAEVLLFVGSVHDDRQTITTDRPNSIEINVTVNGVITHYVFSDYLNGNGDLYWDSVLLDILIPSGATELTIQVFSRDDLLTGNLPASLEWITGVVSIPEPPLSNEADLSITKTASPDPVIVGQDLTYTITVTNNGPDQANGVTVTDTLPPGVAYVSALPSQGSCIGTTTVTCSIGSLSAGGSAAISIVVTTLWDGTISNSSSVTGTESDPDTGNNFTSVLTTVSPSVDLSVTKSDSPDPVDVGDSLLYTITVTNNGPSDATGVTVTDTLPAGVDYVSATPSQGSCIGTITVTCSLGNLLNGASATVMIVVTPTVAGILNNSASVTGSEYDPDLANNSTASVSTTVNNPPAVEADLSITKVDFPDPVILAGDPLTYTITVTNNGPITATGVTVNDTLPVEVIYVSHTTTQGTCIGTSAITCNIGTLANGASATVTIEVQTTIAGLIGNTATVSRDQTDPNSANDSVMQTTNVGDVSRLLNISTRAYVGTVDDREIGGFIIGGILPKTVLIRGRGPSMSGAPFNISGTLSNPYLRLYSSSAAAYVAQNDNWGDQSDTLCSSSGLVCGAPADITATGIDPCVPNPGQSSAPPGCSNESAMLITLPPGSYTAVLSGVSGGTGVGLIEVFDTDGSTLPKLINISTRAHVFTGDRRMIGGFIIGAGSGNKKILLRARGPSMSGAPFNISGTLSNPYMRLYSANAGAYIAQNDNWGDQSDTLCSSSGYVCGTPAEITATGMDPCVPNPGEVTAPPGCSDEAAILITVPPGGYTAVVSGVSNGTGVGLVEIFELP